jgi:hypothetical protein
MSGLMPFSMALRIVLAVVGLGAGRVLVCLGDVLQVSDSSLRTVASAVFAAIAGLLLGWLAGLRVDLIAALVVVHDVV